MKCHGARFGIAPQFFLGLAVMLLGLLLVLENFGLLEARRVVRLWPLLLVAVGLFRLFDALRSGGRPTGALQIVIGTELLLVNLGVIKFSQALAVFLLLAGGLIAWRAMRQRGGPQVALLGDPDGQLDLSCFMSYVSRADGSPDFRGGHVTAFMGACEIDLRGARIAGGAVVINVFAFWGGVEIRVPSDWMVEGRGMAVLGAFEDKSRRADDDRQKLIVTGMVIMGGVEVKN